MTSTPHALLVAFAMLFAGSLFAGPAFAAPAEPEPAAERRIALVVGNAAYPQAPLATPVNDAGLVAGALAETGFEVTALANADAATVRAAFAAFTRTVQAAGGGAVAVVYLAGYGIQVDGDNYFAPLDARIARDVDVPGQALSLSDLAQALEATPARGRLLIYNLARATPYARTGLPLAGGLGIPISPDGTATAFDAAPGAVAPESAWPYGVYAQALAEMIRTPGLPLATLLRRVRLRVCQRTNGEAVPYDTGRADIAFLPAAMGEAPPTDLDGPSAAGSPPGPAFLASVGRDTLSGYADFLRTFPNERLAGRVRALQALRREELTWTESLRVDTARAYWTYMRRYPRGPHFGDVRRRLAALNVALEPPPRFDLYDNPAVPPPGADEKLGAEASASALSGPGATSVPPLPASLLPPMPARFDAVVPPPIVPLNAVPVPPPASRAPIPPGRVVQSSVAGYDALVSTVQGASVELTADGATLARTSDMLDRGRRTIVETNAIGAVISRATIFEEAPLVTVLQTGPAGETLARTIVRAEADGRRTVATTSGAGRPIASWTTTADGAMTNLVRGQSPVEGQLFVLMPGQTADALPVLLTRIQAEGVGRAPPLSLPVLAVAAGGTGAPQKIPEASFPRSADAGTPPFGSLAPGQGSPVSLPQWSPPGSARAAQVSPAVPLADDPGGSVVVPDGAQGSASAGAQGSAPATAGSVPPAAPPGKP